ncbi:MAG: hypothetical protein J2P25_07290 [Nocardiopsaceae bacterium]|nr:hypothetical protein [Nocardiopsaceae bacterium]
MTPEERRDDAEARFWCAVEEPAPEAERLEAAELLDRVLQAEAEGEAEAAARVDEEIRLRQQADAEADAEMDERMWAAIEAADAARWGGPGPVWEGAAADAEAEGRAYEREREAEAEAGADTGYPEWSPEENAQAEAEWEAYQREPDGLYVPDGMPTAGQLADDEANRTGFRYPEAVAEADRPGGHVEPQAEPGTPSAEPTAEAEA